MRRIALLRFTAGTDDSAAFEARLKASIGLAAEQQALGWELRSMTSLARLWQEQGRREEGLKGLSEIYERFTEGHETPDLKRAQELIAELDRAPAGMPLATISRK